MKKTKRNKEFKISIYTTLNDFKVKFSLNKLNFYFTFKN